MDLVDFDPKKNVSKLDYFLGNVKQLITVRSVIKNWQDVLLFRLGFKKPGFIIEFRNGLKYEINTPEEYFRLWQKEPVKRIFYKRAGLDRKIAIDKRKKQIKFSFLNKQITFCFDSNKQLHNTIGLVKEQFLEGQYAWLDVKGKDVVDIGANIGDTAIYFALKGAKHVYAFEPYPYSYNLALKNIKLNRLQDKITLLNEGCSGKEGIIKIEEKYKNMGNTALKEFNKGKEIKLTTLGEIIKRFNLNSDSVIKIDCEGCEYAVLLKAKEADLRRFKQMQIEYHKGYLNLKKKLEKAGFSVTKTISNTSLGLIYAIRKDL